MRLTTPTSPDAEKNLIGSVIIDPGLLDEYSLDRVPPEAFYNEKNRTLWRHILTLYWGNKPIDIPSVIESIRLAGDLEKAGSSPHVLGVVTEMEGTGTYSRHYADTVLESWKRRQLLDACTTTMQEAVTNGYDDALDKLQQAVHKIDPDTNRSLEEAAVQAEKVMEGVEQARLMTGFRGIDRMIGGLPLGDLTVLAARTSMGKSALAHNIAFRVGNTHVLSPDQPLPEIMVSETCRRSRIPLESLRSGEVSEEKKEAWRAAFKTVKGEMETLVTFDDGHLPFTRMVSEVRRAARRGKRLVVVDHVQHVRSSNHRDKRMLMVDITGTLKAIAREEGIAVLALSQLTRDIDFRPDKRPALVDLSESKTLEEDANVVLFLYRNGYYHPGAEDANLAEVIVGKSKTSARLSFGQFLWNAKFMEFEDLT